MKIACGTVLFRKHSLEKALEAIKIAGYEYVETQAVGPWCPHVTIGRTDPVRYAQMIKEFGFKGTTAIWMPCGTILSNPDSVEMGIRTIEWAKAAGIPVVNTGDGFKPQDMDDEKAFGIFAERMERILEEAEKNRVHIAVEPHGTFSLTGEGLERLMTVSTSPWLGVNYDPCNVYRASYVESRKEQYVTISAEKKDDEAAVLKRIVNRVVHFHAKDVCDNMICPLGTGKVKLAECFALLRKANYDGAVSLETDGDDDFETSLDYAKRGLAFLKMQFGG
ncbi:MAG: sugar phosphate isomerase/epimerase [Treponema sp.]|jgi:sugar phosphate isomerase/epimerase|nr:sugar phosphate isomerase/epimerase [Treponema sp.]